MRFALIMTVPPYDRAIDCGNRFEGKTHKYDFTSLKLHYICFESIFLKIGRVVSLLFDAKGIIKLEIK